MRPEHERIAEVAKITDPLARQDVRETGHQSSTTATVHKKPFSLNRNAFFGYLVFARNSREIRGGFAVASRGSEREESSRGGRGAGSDFGRFAQHWFESLETFHLPKSENLFEN
jgi:hypothetical protein